MGLVVVAGLAFAGWKGQRRWVGESLAKSLRPPTRNLCQAYPREVVGVVSAGFLKRRAVRDAQSSLRAAEGFAAIRTHPVPTIEERLVAVRVASAAVKAALTADCSFKLEGEAAAPATPEIERCVATVHATRTVGELMDALDGLVQLADAWSGVSMPSMRTCDQEWP
jgi:hypothetical protein